MARDLAQCPLPFNAQELGVYLEALKQTLILARASRAHVAASLTRVRAASRFQSNPQLVAAERQDFGDSAEICRNPAASLPMSSGT